MYEREGINVEEEKSIRLMALNKGHVVDAITIFKM